jgi:hypothetical protein
MTAVPSRSGVVDARYDLRMRDRTGRDLYRVLAARPPIQRRPGPDPGPDRTLTATIETADNDRAVTGLADAGLPPS